MAGGVNWKRSPASICNLGKSLVSFEISFCIEVAAFDYREGAVASLEEAWHADVFRKFMSEALRERAAVAWEGEAERAAKDDAIWFELDGLRNEAEEHALDDVVPRGAVGDLFDELAVTGANSAGGSEVFPFVFFAMIEVFFVAGLEVAVLV